VCNEHVFENFIADDELRRSFGVIARRDMDIDPPIVEAMTVPNSNVKTVCE